MAEKGLLCHKLLDMILNNNNLSPIPFYGSLAEQDFRKWYAYGGMYPHRVSSRNLVPFFFTVDEEGVSVDKVSIFQVCCADEEVFGKGSYNHSFADDFSVHKEEGGDVPLGNMIASQCGVVNGDGCSTIFYCAPNINIGLAKGAYFMQFDLNCDGGLMTVYSDVFFVEPSTDLNKFFVGIKWYDGSNLELSDGGVIPYSHAIGKAYGNQIYLDTTIGMPEYSFTEDGEERDGRFFPIKQISEKVYKFKAVVPEYLCDCMRLIRLSDVVTITDQLGRTYNVEHFEMDVKWLDGGHLAEIDCSFETDTVVKKVGKAYGTITPR